jgi:hypothetical protein
MLVYVERHLGITVDRVLARSPGRMESFLPSAGAVRRSRLRSPRISVDVIDAERARLDAAVAGDMDPRTAAIAMLADALRLVVLRDRSPVLSDCGDAAWVVKECVDYLLMLHYRYELSVFAVPLRTERRSYRVRGAHWVPGDRVAPS